MTRDKENVTTTMMMMMMKNLSGNTLCSFVNYNLINRQQTEQCLFN